MTPIRITTAAECKRICAALAASKPYKLRLKYGPSSRLVKDVAGALELLGIADKDTFLRSCAITIGDSAYLPFRIGAASPSYASQIATVAHECQHRAQAGHLDWPPQYLTNKSKRAEYETQAYAVTQEVLYRLTGSMPDARKLAEGMAFYGLGRAEIDYAARYLAMRQATLRRGGQSSRQMEIIAKEVGR